MRHNPRLRQGLEPTLAELQSGAGCELVANRAHYAFQQGDTLTAFYLLWEAIASAAVLIVEPSEREQATDPTLRQQCLKKLREYRYLRETEAQTLRAFLAVRDYLVDSAPPTNRRAQEALNDESEQHRLFEEAHRVLERLTVELPE
ncbi:MAG: hypothetical protein N2651_01970 [Fimbriimonadales bacterium]|nr:hypothetical protein [Fimbriimonadales bacterium]